MIARRRCGKNWGFSDRISGEDLKGQGVSRKINTAFVEMGGKIGNF